MLCEPGDDGRKTDRLWIHKWLLGKIFQWVPDHNLIFWPLFCGELGLQALFESNLLLRRWRWAIGLLLVQGADGKLGLRSSWEGLWQLRRKEWSLGEEGGKMLVGRD